MISVSRVALPHVHQPRALASAAALGSPAHVPLAVGDHEGILNPLSSCIHCCTSGEATRHTILSAHLLQTKREGDGENEQLTSIGNFVLRRPISGIKHD